MTNGWTAQQITDPLKIAWGTGGSPAEFEKLAGAGFNIAQMYNWPYWSEEQRQAASEAAVQYQIGLMPWPGHLGQDYGTSWMYPEYVAPEQNLITQYAQDPAIYGWMHMEEPGMRPLPGEEQLASYEYLKAINPEWQMYTIFGQSDWALPEKSEWEPQSFDVMGYDIYPYAPGVSDPEAALREALAPDVVELERIAEATQMGKTFVPLMQADIGMRTGYEDQEVMPQLMPQYDIWSQALGDMMSGMGFWQASGELGFLQQPEIWSQFPEVMAALGGTPYVPPETPDGQIPIDYGPVPIPMPYEPPTGGDGTMPTPNLWTEPYGYHTPYPWDLTYPEWTPTYEGETFPWARSMYPAALGPGPESGEHYIPGFPAYRQFPYTPPTPTSFQYAGYPTPEGFYSPITTPTLDPYAAGGAGAYPETQPFVGPTQTAATDYIGQMLRGEIEIPGEAEIWQDYLGRTSQTESMALEEFTKASERGGRVESGLYGLGEQQIIAGTKTAREQFAGELATRKAELRVQAQQAAIPLSMAQTQYGAGEADRVQQARERMWGAETSDLFNEFTSKLEVATTDYEMRTAQNELLEAGQERAFQVAREEYQKVFDEAKESGLRDDEAEELAWERGLTEWMQLYESMVMAAQQEYNWTVQRRAWSAQLEQIAFGAQQAAPTMLDYLGMALGQFVGGIGEGIGGR